MARINEIALRNSKAYDGRFKPAIINAHSIENKYSGGLKPWI